MIAVLQRVSSASVSVDGETVGSIGTGLLILLGVFDGDSSDDADFLARKISGFRIFADDQNNMNLSIRDVQGAALVISQFTLCGDWRKGRRPSFTKAAAPEKGEELYRYFGKQIEQYSIPVQTGKFGAMMEVQLTNQGPVTFVLDSKEK